jgi:hypothetical protein
MREQTNKLDGGIAPRFHPMSVPAMQGAVQSCYDVGGGKVKEGRNQTMLIMVRGGCRRSGRGGASSSFGKGPIEKETRRSPADARRWT